MDISPTDTSTNDIALITTIGIAAVVIIIAVVAIIIAVRRNKQD